MMMLGRKDPCHCGSGTKYKSCCYRKDAEAAARAKAAAAPPQAVATRTPASRPAPVVDKNEWDSEAPGPDASPFADADSPEMARWNAFFARYESAPLDEKVALAVDAVRTEPAFDREWCFELVQSLSESLFDADRDAELRALVDEIIARHPAVAELEPIVCWVRARLAIRRGDDPTPHALELARANPDSHVARLLWAELLYIGRPDAVEAALRSTRTRLGSDDDSPFRGHADEELETNLVIDRMINADPQLSGKDPKFVAALREIIDIESDVHIERIVDRASGRAKGGWRARDFGSNGNERGRSLRQLSHEWAHWMNARAVWPRSRVELARDAIVMYLARRLRGSARSSAERLVPDANSLRERLEGIESEHTAVALLEAIPSWCAFLAQCGLAKPETVARAATSLRSALGALRVALGLELSTARQIGKDLDTAWGE